MFKIQRQNAPDNGFWLVKLDTYIGFDQTADIRLLNNTHETGCFRITNQDNNLCIDPANITLPISVNGNLLLQPLALKHLDQIQIGSYFYEIIHSNQAMQQLALIMTPNLARDDQYWQIYSLDGHQANKPIQLKQPRNILGNQPTCDIQILHHLTVNINLELIATGGKVLIKNLSRDIRVHINNQTSDEAILQDGDELTLAGQQFRLVAPKYNAFKQRKVTTVQPTQAQSKQVNPQKKWKTKPTSQGNRLFDDIDQLQKTHEKFNKMSALLFFLSTLTVIATSTLLLY